MALKIYKEGLRLRNEAGDLRIALRRNKKSGNINIVAVDENGDMYRGGFIASIDENEGKLKACKMKNEKLADQFGLSFGDRLDV